MNEPGSSPGSGSGEESQSTVVDAVGSLDQVPLREKVAQLVLLGVDDFDDLQSAAELGVGGFVFGGARPPTTDPTAVANRIDHVREVCLDRSSLNVPVVFAVDALHGNATVDGATVFPHNVGMGATRDPNLARAVGAVTAESLHRMGVDWNLAPGADILRDPRWGRYYEGVSESPWLTGDMARASILGHRQNAKSPSVGTCLKHFAGYSVPENGNDRSGANVSTRDLRTNVLPAYERALDGNPETLMASSGTINGVPAHASSWLLRTVLRERWDYDGLIVSDWEDIENLRRHYEYVSTYAEAIEAVMTAGIDVFMLAEDPEHFVDETVELVSAGRISEERIDRSVRRFLTFKSTLGLFDDSSAARQDVEPTSEGRKTARKAVERSVTLLENEDALPFEDPGDVVVTGPAADSVAMQMGGWTLGWQCLGDGEAIDATPAAITILDGIRQRADDETTVTHVPTTFEFEPGPSDHAYSFDVDEVASAVSEADTVVVAIGEGPYAEWFGDRDELKLPAVQRTLVETVSDSTDAETTVVGIVVAGRPRGSAETFDYFDAVAMAYLPGTAAGSGLASILFGETNPSGRLPFVWPEKVGRVPDYHNDVTEPREVPETDRTIFERETLYQFGHGLSYSDFQCVDLSITPHSVESVAETPSITVEATVLNAGGLPGEHVLDVYATPPANGTVMHPKRRLLAYDRHHLDVGEETVVTMSVPLERFAVVPGDVLGHQQRVVECGSYTLRVNDQTVEFDVDATAPVDGNGPVGRD